MTSWYCNNHSISLELKIGFFVHFPRYETRWEKVAQEQSAVFLGDCAAEMATEVDRYDFGDFGFAKVRNNYFNSSQMLLWLMRLSGTKRIIFAKW